MLVDNFRAVWRSKSILFLGQRGKWGGASGFEALDFKPVGEGFELDIYLYPPQTL